MAVAVIMPKAGMVMEEGTILKWLKNVGDPVKKGEPLVEIETDKVAMEIEAAESGYLIKITGQEGEVVPVTKTIGYIGEQDELIECADRECSPQPADKADMGFLYDVLVVGGGPAGYVAAIKAAQLGGKVALIEKNELGGTCLNHGCIPTKIYLKNAAVMDDLEEAHDRGINVPAGYAIDIKRAVAYKNKTVGTLRKGIEKILESHHIDVFHGEAQVLTNQLVQVQGNHIQAKKLILAGGSKPYIPPIEGIDSERVLTSKEALDLERIPKSVVILGMGVVGIELAFILRSYGTVVTMVKESTVFLPKLDREVAETLYQHLRKKGVQLQMGRKIHRIKENLQTITIELDDRVWLESELCLVALGRVPDLLAAEKLQLQTKDGVIQVNSKMETSMAGVYAPGDINGVNMLAHAAFEMGETAAVNAMGGNKTADLRYVPKCIYTRPEVAWVGLTEEEAKKDNEICVGKFPFSANGKALSHGEKAGFVKIVADQQFGEILGVHIIGANATEMINEAAALMQMEITVHELAAMVHAHPTFSEALKEAAADCLKQCIHLPKKH